MSKPEVHISDYLIANPSAYKIFKKAYESCNSNEFDFKINGEFYTLLKSYSKYLIEYVDSRLSKTV